MWASRRILPILPILAFLLEVTISCSHLFTRIKGFGRTPSVSARNNGAAAEHAATVEDDP
jgi:hypothetical protein